MHGGTLIPNPAEAMLVCLRSKAGAIEVELRASRPSAACPSCGIASARVHSRYQRKLADLPWEGVPVRMLLQARKFFCTQPDCSQQVFAERLPGTVARYARRSSRSSEALNWVTLALGGRAGARLARKLGLLASGPTLLRELRRRVQPAASPQPRVVGIDEWAWKKGHRYGTILCDLEQGRVIDLLPNRNTETVAAWLRRHPSIQVVSRDRASAFAGAIVKGAPGAKQVADRWHLLNNLIDTLGRSLERHRHTLHDVAERTARRARTQSMGSVEPKRLGKALACKQQNRERRLARHRELIALIDGGINRSEAARHMGLPLRTVQRWLSYGAFPERKQRIYPSIVDAYGPYLEKRYTGGCRQITRLWQEVQTMGFEGHASAVRHWLRQRFGSPKDTRTLALVKRSVPVSPQRVAWLMLKADPTRHRYLKRLYRQSLEIASLGHVARELFEMIRTHNAPAWPRWLEKAESSPLAAFARRLRRDQHAVLAALEMPWSNGMVEGQIHRLKLLKRQMYGRAGFDLLRLRVLHAA